MKKKKEELRGGGGPKERYIGNNLDEVLIMAHPAGFENKFRFILVT